METARDPGLFWAFFSTCLNLPPGVARCCLLCSFRRLQFSSRCSWDGPEVEVPPQCLLGNIVVWFSEGVPNPLAPSNLDVDSFLLSSVHNSSLLMISGQWIPTMDLRHMLTKDYSLLEAAFVALHVSEP